MNYSFISPKTQFENVGDVLIYREMIRLASTNSKVRVDSSRCPASFRSSLGLENADSVTYTSGGFFGLLYEMLALRIRNKQCYYYLSPGGYFGEIEGAEIIKRYINFAILLMMNIVGIKIIHVGVSYERLGAKFLRLIALRSKFLYRHVLRDPKSARYADANGIKYSGVSPDLAFNLYSEEREAAKANKICFSFRTDQDDQQYSLIWALIQLCDEVIAQDYEFIFYAQVERDEGSMKKMADQLKTESQREVSFVSLMGEVDESIAFFHDVEMIVSNRLHVLLMGGVNNASVVAVTHKGYNEKVRGLMDSLEQNSSAILDLSSDKQSKINCIRGAEFKFTTYGLDENRALVSTFKEIYA